MCFLNIYNSNYSLVACGAIQLIHLISILFEYSNRAEIAYQLLNLRIEVDFGGEAANTIVKELVKVLDIMHLDHLDYSYQ